MVSKDKFTKWSTERLLSHTRILKMTNVFGVVVIAFCLFAEGSIYFSLLLVALILRNLLLLKKEEQIIGEILSERTYTEVEKNESDCMVKKTKRNFTVAVALILILLILPHIIEFTSDSGKSNNDGYDYDKGYGYTEPYKGESVSDYIKRQDPDLYNDIVDRYNSLE